MMKLICKLFGHGLCLSGNNYYCCSRCGEKNYKCGDNSNGGLVCKVFGHNKISSGYWWFIRCSRCDKTWSVTLPN